MHFPISGLPLCLYIYFYLLNVLSDRIRAAWFWIIRILHNIVWGLRRNLRWLGSAAILLHICEHFLSTFGNTSLIQGNETGYFRIKIQEHSKYFLTIKANDCIPEVTLFWQQTFFCSLSTRNLCNSNCRKFFKKAYLQNCFIYWLLFFS